MTDIYARRNGGLSLHMKARLERALGAKRPHVSRAHFEAAPPKRRALSYFETERLFSKFGDFVRRSK